MDLSLRRDVLQSVDPRFLHAFAWGDYDKLFSAYRNYVAPEVSETVHLVAAGKRYSNWALVKPKTTRTGEILWSNFLPYGAEVRSSMPFSYGARPIRPGSGNTNLDPRWLKVVWMPPKPGRSKARFNRRLQSRLPRVAA